MHFTKSCILDTFFKLNCQIKAQKCFPIEISNVCVMCRVKMKNTQISIQREKSRSKFFRNIGASSTTRFASQKKICSSSILSVYLHEQCSMLMPLVRAVVAILSAKSRFSAKTVSINPSFWCIIINCVKSVVFRADLAFLQG